LADYLGLLEDLLGQMAEASVALRERHPGDPEVQSAGRLLETWSRLHLSDLMPFADRYGRKPRREGQKLRSALLGSKKPGGFGLVRDLHDLWVLAHGAKIAIITLTQAARTLRDQPLETVLARISFENERQIAWILTKLKHSAPQALVVPS